MFPQIPPVGTEPPDLATDAQHEANRLYRSALKMVSPRRSTGRSPARSGDLLVRWNRASRRHFFRLDRWRPALDRFREAARLGGVVCSSSDQGDAATRASDLVSFTSLVRVAELFARRLTTARRFDWAMELQMDALRAAADLRRDADWEQCQLAIESEMHLMRELRSTLSHRRIQPQLLERAVTTGKDVFGSPMDRGPLLRHEYLRRTESRYTHDDQAVAPPREQIRRAIYHCLIHRKGSNESEDLFEVVDRDVAICFPEEFIKQHQIPERSVWVELIDDALKSEIVELYQMSARMDARDAAAGATLSFLCVAAYHRRLGFYPENLESACVEFDTDVPRDPFAAGSQPLQLRLAGGERLRGAGVDNVPNKVRTQVSQPLVYSTGPDHEDDNGAVVWNGMSAGKGDWIFPLPAHRRPRHWRQFDLRKAMIAMTMFGVFLAYFNSPASRQRRAVKWIEETGGSVEYETMEGSDWRATLTDWFGIERFGTPYYVSIGVGAPTGKILDKMAAFHNLTTINLDNCEFELGDLARLQQFPKLESLYLDGADVSASEFEALAGLPRLRELRCGSMCMDDERFKLLPSLPELTSLTLSHTELTGATFGGLSKKFPKLNEFILYGSSVNDDALKEVGKLTGLTYLDLDSTKITNDGLAHLTGLRNLETLDVQRTNLSDPALRHLVKLTKLQELRLNETRVDGSGLVHLLKLPKLRDLSLNSTLITDKDIPTLAKFTSLVSLSVSETRITPKGAAGLKPLTSADVSLPDWPSVWMLDPKDTTVSAIQMDQLRSPPSLQSPP